jgi:hypothetical protein
MTLVSVQPAKARMTGKALPGTTLVGVEMPETFQFAAKPVVLLHQFFVPLGKTPAFLDQRSHGVNQLVDFRIPIGHTRVLQPA